MFETQQQLSLLGVLDEPLRHYDLWRNVQFTAGDGNAMRVNFEVTDATTPILSVKQGAGSGAMTFFNPYGRGRFIRDAAGIKKINTIPRHFTHTPRHPYPRFFFCFPLRCHQSVLQDCACQKTLYTVRTRCRGQPPRSIGVGPSHRKISSVSNHPGPRDRVTPTGMHRGAARLRVLAPQVPPDMRVTTPPTQPPSSHTTGTCDTHFNTIPR